MAKQPTIVTLTGSFGSQAAINTSLENIQAAFDNTISRDGSTPNTMEADLDLNNNDLLNIGEATINSLIVQGVNVTPTQLNNITVPDWKGAWLTATAYAVNDIVRESGSSYICVEAHTSGTFATDLADGKWELFAQSGSAGAGTGDLLAANNLSDLANADTALANLGGGTTGIALFKDSTAAAARTELGLGDASIKGVTGADANAVTGTAGTDGNLGQWNVDGDLVDGPDVLDEDDMASDSATAVATQQSIKAYVDDSISALGASLTVIAAGQFDGTGTPAFNYQTGFNTTITDNGTGHYTLAFDSAEADANYLIFVSIESDGSGAANRDYVKWQSKTVNGFDIRVTTVTGGNTDDSNIHVMAVRLTWS